MPLPDDERIVALANDLLKQFDTLFGLHPGFRAGPRQGRDAHRRLHSRGGRAPAYARSARYEAKHSGDRAVLQLDRHPDDSRQHCGRQPARHGDPL